MRKINHVVENIKKETGGIRSAVLALHEQLLHQSLDSKILTFQQEKTDTHTLFTSKLPWIFSSKYKNHLKEYCKYNEGSVFHLHGVWQYPQYITTQIIQKYNIPSIITPHGMLEPWHLNDKKWKKKLYIQFFLNNIIKKTTIIHAITPQEKDQLNSLFRPKRIELIPNLINMEEIPIIETNQNNSKPYILFIGRLHPKKGLELLIEAFTKINNPRFDLKIIGELNEYGLQIQKKTTNPAIQFLGAKYGNDKYTYLQQAWAVVTPSYSEAIGMVNLEAATVKTPVITTFQTGLHPDWNKEGGILIQPEINNLKEALINCMQWSENERNTRGKQLHQFVYDHYSWQTQLYKWTQLYSEI